MATTHARITATSSADAARAARPTHLRLVTASDAAPLGVRRQPPLRLTHRGRVVLRGLVVLVMLGLMAGVAPTMARRATASDGPARPVVVVHHVVLPGETLWAIATSVAPKADPRDTIARVVEFNSLTSSAVRAGQSLAIPPDLPGRR
jgi:hypothetical protein